MRNVGRDEKEITRFIDAGMFKSWAITRFSPALDDIYCGLVAIVIVRCRFAARRYDHQVHAYAFCARAVSGNTLEVLQLLARKMSFAGSDGNNFFGGK